MQPFSQAGRGTDWAKGTKSHFQNHGPHFPRSCFADHHKNGVTVPGILKLSLLCKDIVSRVTLKPSRNDRRL